MLHNKLKSVALFGLFLILILLGVFLFKNNISERTENIASVANALQSQESVVSEINSLTKEAENLAKNINSLWTLIRNKEDKKTALNNVLMKRKDLLEKALLQGIDIGKTTKPSNRLISTATNKRLIENLISLKNVNINTLHEDNFLISKSNLKYLVSTDTKSYNLILPKTLGYVSGKIANLDGVLLGSTIYVEKLERNKIVKNNRENQPQGASNNTLVILVNFPDTQDVPFTKAEAENLIFHNQLNKFMKEQSFNKADFKGDVYGWVTLNSSGPYCEINYEELDQYAIANGIDISKYDHYLNILNCPFGAASGYSSIGKIDVTLGQISGFASSSVVKLSLDSALAPSYFSKIPLPFVWRNFETITAHELGHALGLPHANALDCDTNKVSSPCSSVEYGNPFDIMGVMSGYALHTNAFYKKSLGWINDNDTVIITKSGKYKMSSLESGTPSNPNQPGQPLNKRLAIIQLPGHGYPIYAIEHRTGSGFDSGLVQKDLSGFYIHKIASNYNLPATELIDLKPSNLDWTQDFSYSLLEEDFSDPNAGLVVKKVSDQEIEVIMAPLSCVPNPPSIKNSEMFGFNGSIIVTNEDNYACPKSNFVTEVLPNQFIESIGSINSENIYPGQQFSGWVGFSVVPGTPPGTYSVDVKSTNTTSGISHIEKFSFDYQPCTLRIPVVANLRLIANNLLLFETINDHTPECLPGDFITTIAPNPILSNLNQVWSINIPSSTLFSGLLGFEVVPNTPPGDYNFTIMTTDLSSGFSTKTPFTYTVK